MGIFEAIRINDINRIKDLIANGVDMDIKDQWGNTPLHYAASEGHLDIVRLMYGYV